MHTPSGLVRAGLAALAVLLATPATLVGQGRDDRHFAASLDSLGKELRAAARLPGLTILVARGPRVLFAKGYGYANLDHDVLAGPQTVYGVGSITKQFVAAAVLRLAEEGKLGLDHELAKYVPEFPTNGRVTLRHLLAHTSGIRGGASLPGRNPERIDYSRQELIAALADVYKDRAAEFSPGEAWAYQSINYSLLGLVVEKVSGLSLWDYLRETFFAPLGMTSTAQCNPTVVAKHRATGYVRNTAAPESVMVASFVSPTFALGGTGLCSSASDLLRWQRALVGHTALSAESYARMIQPEPLNDGTRTDYGYGLVLWDIGGERMSFHTGGTPGYTAYLAYMPASDVTVVVLVNASSDILAIGPTVVRVARGLPQPRDVKATREELARYVGTYESGRVKMTVTERDGQLRADVSGSNSFRFLFAPNLLKQDGREFAVGWEPGSRVTFLGTGERPDAAVLRYGGRTVELRRTN